MQYDINKIDQSDYIESAALMVGKSSIGAGSCGTCKSPCKSCGGGCYGCKGCKNSKAADTSSMGITINSSLVELVKAELD